jgi:hypothetical protein
MAVDQFGIDPAVSGEQAALARRFFGLATGQMFRGFVAGGVAGMLLYPSGFVGLLEMPRILYLCEARYFPVVVIIIIAVIFVITMVAAQEARSVARRPLL